MDAEIDYDDEIGARLRALTPYTPAAPYTGAWRNVEDRRRRHRMRRGIAAVATVTLVAVTLVAVVAGSRSGTPRHRVVVVAPPNDAPLTSLLTIAPVGAIDVTPAGPYHAGDVVHVKVPVRLQFRTDDPLPQGISVCYPWSNGETCDPTLRPRDVGTTPRTTYELAVPGWVHTPTGLQPCEQLHCRFEIEQTNGDRIGTDTVDIASGPEPIVPAHIAGVHRDEALIQVALENLTADPSWTRWSATAEPAVVAKFPAGSIAICAFAARLLCDGLVRPDAPRFDGKPTSLVVQTNRLLLTMDGWVDCVEVECAIVIDRNINVEATRQVVGSDYENVAFLPYRLPPTTPEMRKPTLTIEPSGPFHVGDTVTVTLHDPPRYVDPAHRLQLGQCSSDDVAAGFACVTRFSNLQDQTQSWTTLADGSLQQQWPIGACRDPRGCYLAIAPPVKAYPTVARTPRFLVQS